ncbi:MAG: hypothetical protein II875_04185 [Clostridia bacterium]|nr:hypothetical protein [Clostridia bacterium]
MNNKPGCGTYAFIAVFAVIILLIIIGFASKDSTSSSSSSSRSYSNTNNYDEQQFWKDYNYFKGRYDQMTGQ